MTASSQDVLTYVQNLEGAGFSYNQAIAIAGGLGNTMDRRLETLVTRTHFDAELASVTRRFEAVDQRFDILQFRLDAVEKTLRKLEDVPGDLKLHTWMLAVITIVLVVPQLQEWFAP